MSRQDTELPEGYKMTELGPLPEEWRVVRLGEVATIGPARCGRGNHSTIPFIPMSAIPEGGTSISQWELRAPEQIRSGVVISEGDFLLAKITPCLENGKQGIVKGIPGGWGYATTEVFPIRTHGQMVTEFLAFYFLRPEVRQSLASRLEGTTGRQRLPKAVVSSLMLPLPPLPEQRAIAHVLRTVQEAKEATERVVAALRDLKKSLMRHLFTYGPVPLDQAVQVPVKDTGAGPVPEHWSLVTISETCQVRGSSISLSELHSLDTSDESDALVHGIKVADMNLTGNELWILRANLQVRLPEVVAQKKAIPANSIVFPKRGAAIATNKKRMTSTWTVLDPNLIAVIPGPRVNSIFLFYWFQTFDLTELQDPGPTPQLNKKDIDPILFPLPPTSEQQEITSILQAVDRRIQAEEAYARALEALFKTLLHHLMTGKVRVNSLSFAQGG